MPRPGVPNNPTGANSFQGFGTEQPYGEITNQKRLASGAPLAGGKIAAGAINAPIQAGRKAKQPPAQPKAPEAAAMMPPPAPPVQNVTRDVWEQIANMPGAARYPILKYYAGLF